MVVEAGIGERGHGAFVIRVGLRGEGIVEYEAFHLFS